MVGAVEGAPAAGDLHLYFGHADVLFGLVVGEGHRQVVEEAEDVVASSGESVDELSGEGLLRACRRVGVGGASAGHCLVKQRGLWAG